jgi:hypothetical protein
MWPQEGRKVGNSRCSRKENKIVGMIATQEGRKVKNSRYGREKGNGIDRRYFDSGMRSSK